MFLKLKKTVSGAYPVVALKETAIYGLYLQAVK